MSQLELKALFFRKEPTFEPSDCVVEKVIKLSGAKYDSFRRNMLVNQDFIRDNVDLMYHEVERGKLHCIMVVGEGRRDGVLVDSSGSYYARYAAFIPNAADLLAMNRHPALEALNRKLTDIVDYIAEQAAVDTPMGLNTINLEDLETRFGIDLMRNGALRFTVLEMLDDMPGIGDFELDKNVLVLYSDSKMEIPQLTDAQLEISDPNITMTDMYAYGYSWEGMIPLEKEHALALFDSGSEVFLLYPDDTEGAVESREDIEAFDGMFGTENPAWEKTQGAAVDSSHGTGQEPERKEKSAEKPSVVAQIKEARQTSTTQKEQEAHIHKKDKGGPEL